MSVGQPKTRRHRSAMAAIVVAAVAVAVVSSSPVAFSFIAAARPSPASAGARAVRGVAEVATETPLVAAASSPSSGFAGGLAAAAAFMGALAVGGARRRRRACRERRVARLPLNAAGFESMCRPETPEDSVRRRFEALVLDAQDKICAAIEKVDGTAKFSHDKYLRDPKHGGGGGVARVLQSGAVFEKAGVNVSVVHGEMPQEALQAATERGVDRAGGKLEPGKKVPFFACGISSVMHPKNPHCPTMHFNYRFFETELGTWWFGGGTDITPAYLDEEDMRHFHGTYKDVCDKYDSAWYPKFKAWADKYFLIAHRGETRGLGGVFFDDFNTESLEKHLAFAADCLEAVPKAYVPILEKHKNDSFTQAQKDWQLIRRGRYVEFNLVYDRGTVFGLKMLPSGVGRVESILMSLPETAQWRYDHKPEPGTPEHDILEVFKNPRDWV